jgi:hypothetical protein
MVSVLASFDELTIPLFLAGIRAGAARRGLQRRGVLNGAAGDR